VTPELTVIPASRETLAQQALTGTLALRETQAWLETRALLATLALKEIQGSLASMEIPGSKETRV
jgi:hypothetical protein